MQYLHKYGLNLDCVNSEFIKKYLDYFIKIGFISIE